MVHRVNKLNLVIFLFVMIMLVDLRLPWALDPRFDLDPKDLPAKKSRRVQEAKPEVKAHAVASSSRRDKKPIQARKKVVRTKAVIKANRPARDLVRRAGRVRRKTIATTRPAAARAAARNIAGSTATGVAYQRLRLSAAEYNRSDVVQWARTVWKRFLAPQKEQEGPFQVAGENFSLSLDPALYPVLPAMDGGTIIIDADASLSPFVRTILGEKQPDARVVTVDPADPKKFFAAILEAARFYSVVENFSVDFGTEPKLTVTSDFKIEKSSDSLLHNDVLLLNLVGRRAAFPASLVSYLDREGFHVVDAMPVPLLPQPRNRNVVYSLVDGNQLSIVDTLLEALSVPCERSKSITLHDGIAKGVVLSVTADRYYEQNKNRIVVFSYEKNPVQDTLVALLKRNGYQVIALHPEDDFREIADKILSALKLPASYGSHDLWDLRDLSFGVKLSGFAVPAGGKNAGQVFLTNTVLSPFFKELVASQGYTVVEK